MLKPTLARLILLCVTAFPLRAQPTGRAIGIIGDQPLDPARMAAIMVNSRRTLRPASFVLGHKDELALTPEQLQKLEVLARSEEDSAAVRQFRMSAEMTRMMRKREENFAVPQTGWNGLMDEKRVREEACEQAGIGAEGMLNLMRDRKAVGAILTGRQIDRVQQLEVDDVLRVLKPKEP